MKYKLILLILLQLVLSHCVRFKENPLDPTTPTGFFLNYILPNILSNNSPNDSPNSPNDSPTSSTKKIFITGRQVNGKLENPTEGFYPDGSNAIEKADYICNRDLNKPNNSYYKAMISDSSNRRACDNSNCTDPAENIDWVFKPNTSYYRVDGTYLFTTNSAGIVPSTSTIANPISDISLSYWTGIQVDWVSSGNNCGGWSNNFSSNSGYVGISTSINSQWYFYNNPDCSSVNFLLCVEQ
jgi:hypothetical protein